MQRLTALLTSLFLSTVVAVGQDIIGGEILFTRVSSLTYSFDIYLYTQTSKGIQHTNILFGEQNGIWDTLAGSSKAMPNDVTEWHYTANHTFPGNGTYTLATTDSFRLGGIQNITGSATEKIYLQATLVIDPLLGINSSPKMNNKQLQIYSSDGFIYHNPDAIDPDEDSLSFTLIPTSTSNYAAPPGATIDPKSGLVKIPMTTDKYAINIQIEEYRSNKASGTVELIGKTHREMVIEGDRIISIEDQKTNQYESIIYPNPSNDRLTIENHNGLWSIALIDNDGNIVLQKDHLSSNKIEISTAHLSSGVYTLLTVDSKGNRRMNKLIKK